MPRYASSETDDSILGTDDEINEFEQAAGSDEEAEGVAQWEPDAWNEDEDDEDEDDDNQSDEVLLQEMLSLSNRMCFEKVRSEVARPNLRLVYYTALHLSKSADQAGSGVQVRSRRIITTGEGHEDSPQY